MKKIIENLISGVDDSLDAITAGIRRKLRLNDPLQIVSYRSYGTKHRIYVKGRILEDKGIGKDNAPTNLFHNILEMYKRFESDEVPNATVKIRFQDQEHLVITDKEGYFVLNIVPNDPIVSESVWHDIQIELVDAPIPFQDKLANLAPVMIPPDDAEFGIISDIDDTIIKTQATDLLAMCRNVFLNNAQSRLPFAGVSEFYNALQLGRNGKRNNPFFYVSSSPWNLYDLLIDFMDQNKIPAGTLLLRDLSWRENKLFNSGHLGHKFKEIEQILTTYPKLKFVLIGDSGQEDPSIYREVVKKFPGRILAVYIRDVQLSEREKIAIDISKNMPGKEVEMIIVDNTVEAAEHAAKIGLLYQETIPEIEVDKKLDKGELQGKEKISL